jgi:hypothetical protein
VKEKQKKKGPREEAVGACRLAAGGAAVPGQIDVPNPAKL